MSPYTRLKKFVGGEVLCLIHAVVSTIDLWSKCAHPLESHVIHAFAK